MNHTTLVVLVVLAALAAGIYATSTQAALADSINFKQENKQKAKCLALVISRADACNQEAKNEFNVGGQGGSSGSTSNGSDSLAVHPDNKDKKNNNNENDKNQHPDSQVQPRKDQKQQQK